MNMKKMKQVERPRVTNSSSVAFKEGRVYSSIRLLVVGDTKGSYSRSVESAGGGRQAAGRR